jgi:asparagine synthase (glutamine-hydrolysing)
MCGITGFADFTNKSSLDVVKGMAACMAHRGPDGQGELFVQLDHVQVGFGHRRLSIIDLSTAANQPMHYDGLSIVFNGEIYNYNEIRNELIALGHTFKTHSDTEVILHAWRQWGEKCIQEWRGMFTIVLFDERKDELICIRDRAGVKPFLYYYNNNLFLFGSELKNLMAHPAFEKNIDTNAVASYLQYGYVSAPYTIFQQTHKLKAGHYLKLNLKNQSIAIQQYWNVYDYYNTPKLSIGLPEAIEETERILTQSFQYRMVADVPVGVFLSGGYDSTCVTSLLQKNSTDKIKTFTIGVADNKLDEAPFAKDIARHLGTDHTEYYCTWQEALDIIPQLPFYYDEPFADSSAIPTILVSRMARKKVTVALSADAGDEIFAGYNRYEYVSKYGSKLDKIPASIKKIASSLMASLPADKIPLLKNKPNFYSRYDKIKNLLSEEAPASLLKTITQVFTGEELNKFLNIPVTYLTTAHDSAELKAEFYDPVSFMMAVDYQTYMVDDILQKVDRATMSTSLEGREPFLDQKIIEWAAQLPVNYKYHNGQKKYILKQIVHKYIPAQMMQRPKSGFAIPLHSWLMNELKPVVHQYLNSKSLSVHGLLNHHEVEKLVTDFYNGRKESYLKIWHLLMFQMWYERWMA